MGIAILLTVLTVKSLHFTRGKTWTTGFRSFHSEKAFGFRELTTKSRGNPQVPTDFLVISSEFTDRCLGWGLSVSVYGKVLTFVVPHPPGTLHEAKPIATPLLPFHLVLDPKPVNPRPISALFVA